MFRAVSHNTIILDRVENIKRNSKLSLEVIIKNELEEYYEEKIEKVENTMAAYIFYFESGWKKFYEKNKKYFY